MANVIKIRPKKLFREIENRFQDQYVVWQVGIPSTDIGGMTLLESSILVTLIKIFNCKKIFEFGTYYGATTMLFSLNTTEDATIVSLDVNRDIDYKNSIDQSMVLTDGMHNDAFLVNNFLSNGPKYIVNAEESLKRKISLLSCDSLLLDPYALKLVSNFDFIFIDGGHDYKTIERDTENALLMLLDTGVIVWHDYSSDIHTDVSRYLDEFSVNSKIYHVEGTMIAFMVRGDFKLGHES